MGVEALNKVSERARQETAQDKNYLQKMPYFFELWVPAELAAPLPNTFVFPLVIPPESYTMDEPFTVETTNTLGAGVYVEENGIVMRPIKLEGHTGFKPRPMKRQPVSVGITKPERKSYSRSLLMFPLQAVSGQRHFQYLQDAIFRTYADLKRDPATAAETFMFFHNPKDEEHWLVIPQRFTLTRTSDKPVMYRYHIEMLAVDRADALDEDFSEDKKLLDQIKDGMRMVQSGIEMVEGALEAIIAVIAEIKAFVQNIAAIIDVIGDVIGAVADFVDGITALIELPYAIIDSVLGIIDEVLSIDAAMENLKASARSLPETIKQRFRQVGDGMERIGTHPELFETPAQRQLQEIKERQELLSRLSADARELAENTPPPDSLDLVETQGTQLDQSDLRIARADLGIGRNIPRYKGMRSVTVAQGDTLVNLAARYLGDARLWQQIAIYNDLKPPYIFQTTGTVTSDEEPSSGVLKIGSRIRIPTRAKPPTAQPILPVLGVTTGESTTVHLLGTDFELVRIRNIPGRELFDIPIDVAAGSQDGKLVGGIANLSQGLLTRVTVERGTDILFKRLGVPRVIGLKDVDTDKETLRFAYAQALGQDARINSVRRINIVPADDVQELDIDVDIKGLSETTTVLLET